MVLLGAAALIQQDCSSSLPSGTRIEATVILYHYCRRFLGRHVGGWSTTRIGRFYNGRHHTTVLHSAARIERLRRSDESLDALLDVLADDLSHEAKPGIPDGQRKSWRDTLVETVMARITEELTGAAVALNQTNERDIRVVKISVEIPGDIASSFGPDARSLQHAALETLAAQGVRSGRLSQEQAQRLLGLETISDVYRPRK